MTLLRVLLLSSAVIVSVQSFPSTTKDHEEVPTGKLVTKEATEPISVYTEDPRINLEGQTKSEGELTAVEFVFKSTNDGSTAQKGSTHEKYTISNLTPENEDEKLILLASSKENEIDTNNKKVLDKLITGISKIVDLLPEAKIKRDQWLLGSLEKSTTTDGIAINPDLLPEAQIKTDQWLFDPQEKSTITGGLPKYLSDAATPIHPFPESFDRITYISSSSEVGSNKPPARAGPMLYPYSTFSREIDIPYYSH